MKSEDKKKKIDTVVDDSVSLSLTEDDLKNPAVARRIISENQKLQKDAITLEDSLEIHQDRYEKLKDKYHQTDKENAILTEKTKFVISSEIIKFISSVGIGVGITFISLKEFKFGAFFIVISILIYSTILLQRKKM